MSEKDSSGIVLFIFGCFVAAVVFAGIVKAVKHAFRQAPSIEQNAPPTIFDQQAEDLEKTQAERMKEIEEQRKEYMRNQKQRIRDFQRR